MGTPLFMSPEQCMGRGVDHHTDIYAMGAILFNVYCSRLPFTGASSAEIIAAQLYQAPPKPSTFATMAPALEALILECLEKDPAKRPATAADLGLRLKEVSLASGTATEIHAPLAPTELVMADTHKGFQPSESVKINRVRRRSLVLAVSLGVVMALALGLYWRAPARHDAESAKQLPSVPSSAAAVAPAIVPVPQPAPTAAGATAPAVVPVHVLEPPSADGTVPHKRAVAARPAAKRDPSIAPPSASAPTDKGHKPSRAAREGLIQENPF